MFVLVTLGEAIENLLCTYSSSMQPSSVLIVLEYGGMIEPVKSIRVSIVFDTSRKVAVDMPHSYATLMTDGTSIISTLFGSYWQLYWWLARRELRRSDLPAHSCAQSQIHVV